MIFGIDLKVDLGIVIDLFYVIDTTTIFSFSNIVLGSVFVKMLPKENNMQRFYIKRFKKCKNKYTTFINVV